MWFLLCLVPFQASTSWVSSGFAFLYVQVTHVEFCQDLTMHADEYNKLLMSKYYALCDMQLVPGIPILPCSDGCVSFVAQPSLVNEPLYHL